MRAECLVTKRMGGEKKQRVGWVLFPGILLAVGAIWVFRDAPVGKLYCRFEGQRDGERLWVDHGDWTLGGDDSFQPLLLALEQHLRGLRKGEVLRIATLGMENAKSMSSAWNHRAFVQKISEKEFRFMISSEAVPEGPHMAAELIDAVEESLGRARSAER